MKSSKVKEMIIELTCTVCYSHARLCLNVTKLSFTELCLKDLHLLEANSLISMDDGFVLQPTGIC